MKKFDEINRYFIGYFPIVLGVYVLGAIEWAQYNGCSVNFDSTSAVTTTLGFAVLATLSNKFGKFKPTKFETNETIRVATIGQRNHMTTELFLLKNELDKIRLQFSRIKQDDLRIQELHTPEIRETRWFDEDYQKQRHETQVALFADIHFLLISLTNFAKIFHKLLKPQLPTNKEISAIDTKCYKTTFQEYTNFRNNLEHIYQKVGNVGDLGNLANGKFTFGGETFDIGCKRETEIETIFSEILSALDKPTKG